MKNNEKLLTNNAFVCFRKHRITGAPNVKFGTKWPSITSKCIKSAPASNTSWVSPAKFAISEASKEGPMRAGHLCEANDVMKLLDKTFGRIFPN